MRVLLRETVRHRPPSGMAWEVEVRRPREGAQHRAEVHRVGLHRVIDRQGLTSRAGDAAQEFKPETVPA